MAAASAAPRIPLELRTVFLASNRGEEVHDAPQSAFGIFRQGMRLRWSRLLPGRRSRRRGHRRHGSAATTTPTKQPFAAAATTTTADSPSASRTTRSLNDSSLYSDGNISSYTTPTRLFSNRGWFSSKKSHSQKNGCDGPTSEEEELGNTKFHSNKNDGVTADLTHSATDDPSETDHTFDPSQAETLLRTSTAHDTEDAAQEEVLAKPTVSPQDYLDAMIYARGYSTQRFSALESAYHNRPTALQQASFQPFLLNCLKKTGKEGSADLCRLLCSGLSPNPANRFGESLIHKVCRLGRSRLLSDLLHKVPNIDVRYCDEHGRTPLHDACAANSLECWELLCEKDLRLLYVADHLNMVPLQFVPQHAWRDWIVFLDAQKDTYWPEGVFGRGHEEPPPLMALQPPHCRPLKDPMTALPVDLAEQLAAGNLTVERAHDEKERRLAKRPVLGKLIANLDEMYDLDNIDFYSSSSEDDDDDDDESDITDDTGSDNKAGKESEHDGDDDDDDDDDDDNEGDSEDDDDDDKEEEQKPSASNYTFNLSGQQEAMNVILGISSRGTGAAQVNL